MPPRRELCRNFQRGSCQYGARCKFLHAAPQQSNANPFGSGVQSGASFQHTNQQQQMPNPFGFGVQNNSQFRGGNDFGAKSTQFKPFENKWTRFSPINTNNAPASRQTNSQPQPSHKCTDPESCKRVIMEDLENEKPGWKLTCYGHNKDGPCDIVGDISCEELRALAYDDAKNGKSLQYIIDRERSLLNSKLAEFQNLLQKPYTVTSNAVPSTQNPSAGAHFNPINNSGAPPTVSSFSQLGAILNTRPAAAPNYSFGQSNAFQSNSQAPSMFQMNSSLPSTTSGAFGSQFSLQSAQNFSFGSAAYSNGTTSAHKNPFSTFGNSEMKNAAGNQLQFASNIAPSASSAVEPHSITTQLTDNMNKEISNGDGSIWTKPEWKWNAGEIPEQPPPDAYVR